MDDNRNFMLAIALTLIILLGYSYFYDVPRQKTLQEQATANQSLTEKSSDELPDFANPGKIATDQSASGLTLPLPRAEALTASPRITIDSPHIKGSIALKGGRLDDVTLSDYKVSLDKNAPDVALLSPSSSARSYFVDVNWGVSGAKGPDSTSIWQSDQSALTAGSAVTLTWDNGQGLLFSRTIALDNDYMFTITQNVTNRSGKPVKVAQYGRIVRKGRPEGTALYILHEGPMWSLDDGIEEFTYGDLEDLSNQEKKVGQATGTGNSTDNNTANNTANNTGGGWVGISDKYWLVALIPDREKDFTAEIYRRTSGESEKFHANYFHNWTVLEDGASTQEQSRVFAGSKQVSLLDYYAENAQIKQFNYAIDWGMFDFLTKPIFYLLEVLYTFSGNFGIAILLLTALVKLALFPLANKGYKSMNRMKRVQPKLQALKEKYGDDRMGMQQATMELYKKEKINPVSGCLPMFLQFPVFFALYKVLYVTIDMRHAPFFGWIKDLSAPDTLLVTNLFGLIPWQPTGFLALGILPIFMGFTMWLQMQMNPSSGDPMHRKIMMFMPIIFTFMLSQFSVGLVIYWTFSNILGILQQWVLMRRADPIPDSGSGPVSDKDKA